MKRRLALLTVLIALFCVSANALAQSIDLGALFGDTSEEMPEPVVQIAALLAAEPECVEAAQGRVLEGELTAYCFEGVSETQLTELLGKLDALGCTERDAPIYEDGTVLTVMCDQDRLFELYIEVTDVENRLSGVRLAYAKAAALATPVPTPTPAPVSALPTDFRFSFLFDGQRIDIIDPFSFVQASGGSAYLHIWEMETIDGETVQLSLDLPVDMQAGESIKTSDMAHKSGWLYGVSFALYGDPFQYLNASNDISAPYGPDPMDSNYTIRLESISESGSVYAGRFEAELYVEDTGEKHTITDGVFRIKLDDDTIEEIRIGGPLPTPTPAPTVPPKQYAALVRGDAGEQVKEMQRRLYELGYLRSAPDGEFGPQTEAAVMDFQDANGLCTSGIADQATQTALYGIFAIAYCEPDVSLVVRRPTSYGRWVESGSMMRFRIEVENISQYRTVKAFELYAYPVDAWGDNLLGENGVYCWTTTTRVKPGQYINSDYCTMENRSEIAQVYCGVKRVIYTDGTSEENLFVDYSSWTICW